MGIEPFLVVVVGDRGDGAAPGAPRLPDVPRAVLGRRVEELRRARHHRRAARGPHDLRAAARAAPHCKQTGYRGRTGIHELLVVDDDVRALIMKRADAAAIRRAATAHGHGDAARGRRRQGRSPARPRSRKSCASRRKTWSSARRLARADSNRRPAGVEAASPCRSTLQRARRRGPHRRRRRRRRQRRRARACKLRRDGHLPDRGRRGARAAAGARPRGARAAPRRRAHDARRSWR